MHSSPISTILRRSAPMRMRSRWCSPPSCPTETTTAESFSISRPRTLAETYHGALRIMLPDTFGTTQFLDNAPDWAADWTGQRIDSKNPYTGGDEYIAWLKARGRQSCREAHYCF